MTIKLLPGRIVGWNLIITLILTSCANNEDPLPIDLVTDIIVSDNGNEGNASDIEVNFTKQIPTENIREYRVFLVKSSLLNNISEDEINSLTEDRYASAMPEEVFPVQGIMFTESILDFHGDLIKVEESYIAGVISVSMDPGSFSNSIQYSEMEFQLTNNNIIFSYSDEMEAGAGSISINSNGILFMADYDVIAQISNDTSLSHAVQRIDLSGSVTEFTSPLKLLTGNAIDSKDLLFQSTYLGEDIITIDEAGVIADIDIIKNSTGGYTDGIYIDKNDIVYIVDPGSGFIYRKPPNGPIETVTSIRNNPRGITGDPDGNLYVSHNHEEGIISKISPDGMVTTLANLPTYVSPTYQLEFIMWIGYITYHEGSLYVAGTSTHQVFKVSMDGNVTVFAGSGERGIPRGDTRTANLNRPVGLAFSKDGKSLFISCSTDTTPQHTQYSTPSQVIVIGLESENP